MPSRASSQLNTIQPGEEQPSNVLPKIMLKSTQRTGRNIPLNNYQTLPASGPYDNKTKADTNPITPDGYQTPASKSNKKRKKVLARSKDHPYTVSNE